MNILRAVLVLAAAAILPACLAETGGAAGAGAEDPVTVAPTGTGPAVTTTSPGTVQFDSFGYGFDESINVPRTYYTPPLPFISVTRTGGSRGEVSVMVVVTGGTATYGVDYELPILPGATGVVLRWADGELGTKGFEFKPIDDTELEATETADLALVVLSGEATLGTSDKVTVSIYDDDNIDPAYRLPR